jgi:hypothetical protein
MKIKKKRKTPKRSTRSKLKNSIRKNITVISEKMNKNRKMRRDLKRSRITTEKE